jgi:hypothetical protein
VLVQATVVFAVKQNVSGEHDLYQASLERKSSLGYALPIRQEGKDQFDSF